MSTPDRRLRVLEASVFNPDLTYGERAFMVVVCTIKAEFVEGERRHGSKSMGPDGKFTLHLDYLAGALNTSAEGVRKMRRKLEAAGVLQLVHEATHGRPATWQAFAVRGAKNGSLTAGQKGTPYALAGWLTRVAEMAPLTYRTPDQGDHPPESGDLRGARVTEQRHDEDHSSKAVFRPTVCEWHREMPCDPDCANVELTRRQAS